MHFFYENNTFFLMFMSYIIYFFFWHNFYTIPSNTFTRVMKQLYHQCKAYNAHFILGVKMLQLLIIKIIMSCQKQKCIKRRKLVKMLGCCKFKNWWSFVWKMMMIKSSVMHILLVQCVSKLFLWYRAYRFSLGDILEWRVLFLLSIFVRFMVHLPFEPYPITNFMNIIKSILLNDA